MSSPPLSELDSQEMPEVPDGGDANGPSSPNGTGRGDGFVRSPTSSTMKPGSDEEDEDSDLTDEDDEAGAGNAAVGDDVDVDMDAGARPASSPTKPPSASAKSGLSRHDDRSKSKSASASKLEIKQEVAGSDADVDADGEEEDDEEVIISPRTRRAAYVSLSPLSEGISLSLMQTGSRLAMTDPQQTADIGFELPHTTKVPFPYAPSSFVRDPRSSSPIFTSRRTRTRI